MNESCPLEFGRGRVEVVLQTLERYVWVLRDGVLNRVIVKTVNIANLFWTRLPPFLCMEMKTLRRRARFDASQGERVRAITRQGTSGTGLSIG